MSLVRLKIKRDTAANFTASNIVLLLGEWAYETDTFTLSGGVRHYKFKIGDGSTAWVDLPYARLAAVGGGGGATIFTELTDVPGAYTGAAGKYVKVNETADGLEFEVIEAADLPSAIDAAKIGDGTVSNAEFQTLNGASAPYTTAEQTKLAGIETGAEVNDTAAEILTKLLTVDGPGSGLDADTLDGLSSAAFAAALGADDNYVTDAEKIKLGNLSGTNTGDQTSIVGITGTKSQFDTAVTDGNFMYIGDAPTAHTHPQSDITNLVSDLAAKASSTFIDAISGYISTLSDKTYKLVVKIPFACTINETVTICESGTATATFKINTTALGGTANSVSSAEQTQAQASANTVAAGDDIQLTISSNSSCLGLSFTIKITRTI